MAGTQMSICSRNSEDGFHSGGSQEDCLRPPFDQLAYDFSNLALLQQKRIAYGQQKCNSDSGASTGELDQILMKEDVGARDVVKPKMPGSWFYEELYHRGDDTSSPTSESDELYLSQFLNAARNVSENVEVPSSEHVAEIVGRQGCKIKALRAKTNTYIKTPIRGEEPVFVVTGKPEDVMEAKREIECAAEHFTQIRASRRHSQGGAPAPGHVTAYVRVPLRVVGLVVGPKGATIKRIQQDTHTYIITPSREREPIFEVTGLPQNVEAARREIEQHIYQRTGNMPITDPSASISSYTEFSTMQLTAAMNAAASRAGNYGNMPAQPAPPNRRMDAFGPEFGRSTENYSFNNLGMLRAYTKPFSPSPSPNLFSTASPAPFTPWSNSAYNGGLNAFPDNEGYNRTSILNGASAWSTFGVSQDNRDEGIGESPTNADPYRNIMSSIWSDIEPRDENKQAVTA